MGFALQGKLAPGRGIEGFLRAWRGGASDRAVLYLRCPENSYFARLREEFEDAIARFADVGVIPYVGPNLNHIYACPNKLNRNPTG